MEVPGVRTVLFLLGVVRQLPAQTLRVGQVQHDETLDDIRPQHRHIPCDHAAPVVAHDVRVVFDSGAYAGFKPAGHLLGVAGVAGPYRIPNTRITEYMVYTHQGPCGHMRGPGEPQALFALESHIDEIAKELGFTQPEYASALAVHAEHRTVLRSLRAKRKDG